MINFEKMATNQIKEEHLRSVLVGVLHLLSEKDRQSFHFLIGRNVPRPIQDDPTFQGTLNLIETLFDRNKISVNDIYFLIDAFRKIGCHAIAKVLQDYQNQIQSNSGSSENRRLIDDLDLESDAPTVLLHDYRKKHIELSSSSKSTIYFIIVLLTLMGSVIIVFIFVNRSVPINVATNHTERMDCSMLPRNDNEIPIGAMSLSIEDRPLFIVGKKFGESNATKFDDSLRWNVNSLPYFYGFCPRVDSEGLESYQFFYASSQNQQPKIKSDVHGTQPKNSRSDFDFSEKNDRVIQVQGRLVKKSMLSPSGINQTINIITELEFISKTGRVSPLHIISVQKELSEKFSEEYEGYVLGYVTGRSAEYVEQIQFVWYRSIELESNED
ncbi:unnamed protein product [Adineta ricciae]|uniref:DED domain-containing protein n=2 Tax=Adineta ricciae TaxID=249248 RepID=A0A814PRB0_ADIRI|nr:unnamed protein product [Adineta ricciae]